MTPRQFGEGRLKQQLVFGHPVPVSSNEDSKEGYNESRGGVDILRAKKSQLLENSSYSSNLWRQNTEKYDFKDSKNGVFQHQQLLDYFICNNTWVFTPFPPYGVEETRV